MTNLLTATEEIILESIIIEAASDDVLEVWDPKTNKIQTITLRKLSTAFGIKYRTNCINYLLRMVGAGAYCDYIITPEADVLIDKVIAAA